MTIDEIFFEIFDITPEGYYDLRLRNGADAQEVLQEIEKRVNYIWVHEKNGGFYPVDSKDIPEGFI